MGYTSLRLQIFPVEPVRDTEDGAHELDWNYVETCRIDSQNLRKVSKLRGIFKPVECKGKRKLHGAEGKRYPYRSQCHRRHPEEGNWNGDPLVSLSRGITVNYINKI